MILQRLDLLKNESRFDGHLNPSPQMVTYYVTFLLILFIILTASFIFIEIVASFTKKCIDAMAGFMTTDLKEIPHPVPPHIPQPFLFKNQLLDKTCPLISHRPSKSPKLGENGFPLPPQLASPCGICCRGIKKGDLTRIFPCNHFFHARCVDRVCVIAGRDIEVSGTGTPGLECPECSHIIFPTPDLVTDCIISTE